MKVMRPARSKRSNSIVQTARVEGWNQKYLHVMSASAAKAAKEEVTRRGYIFLENMDGVDEEEKKEKFRQELESNEKLQVRSVCMCVC